jgi:hypothetical protein
LPRAISAAEQRQVEKYVSLSIASGCVTKVA